MKKDAKIFIEHILASIELIEKYIKEKTKSEFLNSVQLQDSIIRRLEIIGEAIKNIPLEIKNEHDEVPWKEIIGMRDILIHKYFGIDLELTWETIKTDLPKLKEYLLKINKVI